jgi:AcrR family transcriptional regulator
MTGARRRTVEVRREEILGATIAEVERLGLAATRVADVAAALKVSPALVFYHFGTKDALLGEALAHAVERDLERLDATVARGTDPVDRLRRVLRLYGPTGTAPGWRLWIDAWAVAQREPSIRQVLRRLDRRWAETLRTVVDEGVTSGHFRCADPAATVLRVSALLDGLSVANLVYRTVSRTDLRRWVARAVAAELDLDDAELLGHVRPASEGRTPGR